MMLISRNGRTWKLQNTSKNSGGLPVNTKVFQSAGILRLI